MVKAASLAEFDRALRAVIARSYSPYSGFAVAAVVQGVSGALYAGVNIENAAYPQGWCAEPSALSAMILAGERRLMAVAVMGDGRLECTPCGGCRQKLREFGSDDLPIHIFDRDGFRRSYRLDALLPASFGPDNLKR